MRDEVRRLVNANTKRDLAESLLMERAELERLGRVATDARADERQAMTYLEQCRQAVGHEGDFPSLVEKLGRMMQEG